MTGKEIVKDDIKKVEVSDKKAREPAFIPDVDIIENGEHLKLFADMPGIDKSSVQVMVDSNVLSIAGEPLSSPPEGAQVEGREFTLGRYYREFAITNEIDTSAIVARVENGVLELTLPKREEVKARIIKINS